LLITFPPARDSGLELNMAGQGFERREILRLLASASAVSGCSGFQRWAFAFARGAHGPAHPGERQTRYSPRFFTAEEYALVSLLASLLIPTDDTPGATEAGVDEFIDTMVAHDPSLQPRFRQGLAWFHAHSRLLHGRSFDALTSEEQVAFLRPLAYAAERRPGQEEGRRFFELLREYVVMGYYTSRTGLEQLGYPGLQLYSESPGCPDPEDPSHAHRGRRADGDATVQAARSAR
jgi:hypothetical protein